LSDREADLGAEQEVDLGRYWSAIVARWWLPIAGLLVGALVGYLISLGGKQVWRASSTVYIGAAYSVISSVLLQGPQASPTTVSAIARAETSIDRAAAEAGMRPAELRGSVSTKTIATSTGSSLTRPAGNPLVQITVQAKTRRRAQVAANALATIVVERLSPFADKKIATLTERIESDQKQIDAIRRQAASSSDATSKAVFGVHLGDVLADQLQAKQLLVQAQEVERPQVLTRAAGVKTTARSRRNAVVVAAFLGLLLGLIAAIAWQPLSRRLRR
jgi:prepilin signal peptidase PulO-like enzyme (type II secretory pathway)